MKIGEQLAGLTVKSVHSESGQGVKFVLTVVFTDGTRFVATAHAGLDLEVYLPPGSNQVVRT